MATTKTDKKFGVVHTSPAKLIANATSLEEGKLYFTAGESSGVVKQGIYGVVGVTTDGSIDIDGSGSGKQVAMFGCGSIVDANGPGLMSSEMFSKLSGIANNANDYSHPVKPTTGLSIESPSNTTIATTFLTRVSIDESGHIGDTSAFTGTVGDSSTPIYFKAGVPTKLGYTIKTSVPANAVFTDDAVTSAANHYAPTAEDSSKITVSNGKYITALTRDTKGHIVGFSEADLPKVSSATNADTANKTSHALTIKANGTTVKSFNGSVDTTVELKSGNTSALTVSSTTGGSITITPVTAAVNSGSSALTTGAQVASYVSTELGKLSGALVYKGIITSYSGLPTAASTNTGHVYICSSAFQTTAEQTGVAYNIEVGDMFISNGSKWNIVSSEFDVSTYSNALAWGTDVSIAVVDGVTIKVKLPANPNTDYQTTKDGHYTPAADSSVDGTASGSTLSFGNAVITGISKDSKGHITGFTTSKLPANPNTDKKVSTSASSAKLFLIGKTDASKATESTAHYNASVYIDGSALYSEGAKVLTAEQYKGTVTSITPGTGLTGASSDAAITSTGTINLKIASSSEIGGVIASNVLTSDVTLNSSNGSTANRYYGVQVDKTGKAFVNIPWTDNNDNTWRDVYVGGTQKIGTGTNTGSLKFVNGTNITATWNSTNKTIQFDASGLATTENVATAKSEAISAATIYWETL